MNAPIYTIGHSNHALAPFLALLRGAGVTAIVDVRSKPVSRWVPHFNRPRLEATLPEHGIKYAYLGRALGGFPNDPSLQKDGKPDYSAVARRPAFAEALERVIEASRNDVLALLCMERDPVECHRFRLVSRELAARGVDVAHILPSGEIEPQADAERRAAGSLPDDLFGRRA